MRGYPVSWLHVTSLTVLLMPLSWLFGLLVALRRGLYRSGLLRGKRLAVPVIVVGNISVGGTGKTPLVLWLVTRLVEAGYTPGIISRGYLAGKARTDAPRAVSAKDDAAVCGDEPVLLARRSGCPVWIGADRAATGRALLAAHPECNIVVSDDGLQHYALARDAEIALIDGARSHGNGLLLPAGPLREPVSRLDSVDAVVIRGDKALPSIGGSMPPTATGNAPNFAMSMMPGRFYRLLDPTDTGEASRFLKRRVHAAAGIGNPDHFFNTLKALGLTFTAHSFPDHHPYTQSDLVFADCDAVVMTEKDAVKYERYATENHWALGVAARVEPRLASMLIERIRQRENTLRGTA